MNKERKTLGSDALDIVAGGGLDTETTCGKKLHNAGCDLPSDYGKHHNIWEMGKELDRRKDAKIAKDQEKNLLEIARLQKQLDELNEYANYIKKQ